MDFHKVILRALLAGGAVLPLPAMAQMSPPAPGSPIQGSPPPSDPAQEAAKRAFESLPEADRAAIQDGLIWTGDYKGVPDGKFGKGTRDAIAAFAGRAKLSSDGTLDAKGRAALALAAKQAKEAVRFIVQADEKTGARIGLPLKLLTRTKPLPDGTRYSSADESVWLETSTRPANPASLQDTFTAMTAGTPGRKITYKVLRPDFFVVTGEQGSNAFYTRMARGDRAGGTALNGFTITYPVTARLKFDAITIAITNAFQPFPDANTNPAAASAAITASPAALSAAASGSIAAKPPLLASGVTIAPGLILTSLPKSCGNPQIGTKSAKIVKQTESDGLTLLSIADTSGTALPLRSTDPLMPAQIVVLSFIQRLPAGDELIGGSGDLHKAEAAGSWHVLAALQNPAAGTAVLDRSGALAGLIPINDRSGKPVGGVLPEMNHDVIPASRISAFLADARPKPIEHADIHTTGEIVTLARTAMAAIYCAH